MEKRFAIIAVACMCVVFAIIAFQSGALNFNTNNQGGAPGAADGLPAANINQYTGGATGALGDFPIATIIMEDGGIIKLELYPEVAPNTVNNFIYLANQGFYNGLIFHRVIPGFMIQGGCPEGTGMGGPGYFIRGEFSSNGFENDLAHERGVISMARRAMPLDSAGSQFFIMHQHSPFLDRDYAGFGRVIEGMDVVDRIAETQTGAQDRPNEDQIIREITVETFGVDFPEPEKLPM